jgi:outer membrane protein OmpA-like peptidoglycan-associated protein
MKNLFKTILVAFALFYSIGGNAQQQVATVATQNNWEFSTRLGYDVWQNYENSSKYVAYKGGMMFGASVSHFWKNFGVGIDVDHITNKATNSMPLDNLFYPAAGGYTLITSTKIDENKIKRFFYGIGPEYRMQNKSGKLTTNLSARFGMASVKGGRVAVEASGGNVGAGNVFTDQLINFHAGYNESSTFTYKLQARVGYQISPVLRVDGGVYYMSHGKTQQEEHDKDYAGIVGWYHDIDSPAPTENFLSQHPIIDYVDTYEKQGIQSIGVFAGLTYSLAKGVKKEKKEKTSCSVCGCNITITARDKFTNQILPDTDVVLEDLDGNIVQSGTTNSFGTVVFTSVQKGDYTVKGKLYNVDLAQNTINKEEFKKCADNPIQKEILYTDNNFILKGNAVACNTTTPLNDVSVYLKNTAKGIQKNTMTDNKGEFVFHANQALTYQIYGKKSNFLSQTETVNTADYDRNQTLFIQLEICMEKADCGKAIALKNIHYDLDKYFIRDDAKAELNRLVQFMNDNPTISIEVSSHTDSQGSDQYNETLSQNRADAAVAYLVSQGIDESRLTGVGYGETQLLNSCGNGVTCPDSQHEVNRRTEMKVICPE